MQKFDRAAEDLGNSIHLEHVNVQVPDQRLAQLFYAVGLGLTRDPYLMVSDTNMWINVGRSQFHLPSGKAQVLRGHTGTGDPGRDALLARLAARRQETRRHEIRRSASTMTTWRRPVRGAIACAATSRTPRASGASRSASLTWNSTCRSAARKRSRPSIRDHGGPRAGAERRRHGRAGADRQGPVPAVPRDRRTAAGVRRPSRADVHRGFLRALSAAEERNLISLEDNQYQYRFQDIVDLDKRHEQLFTVEHEVRSFTHPMCLRPLVNRNPAVSNRNYANGYDSSLWAMSPDEYDTVDMRPR